MGSTSARFTSRGTSRRLKRPSRQLRSVRVDARLTGSCCALPCLAAPTGFWNTDSSYEYVSVIAAGALANALIGHGGYSLDAALRLTYPDWLMPAWLVAVAVGAVAAMASRSMGTRPQG